MTLAGCDPADTFTVTVSASSSEAVAVVVRRTSTRPWEKPDEWSNEFDLTTRTDTTIPPGVVISGIETSAEGGTQALYSFTYWVEPTRL